MGARIATATTEAKRRGERAGGGDGSFSRYIWGFVWGFVGGHPLVPRRRRAGEAPASTAESDAMSRELKRRGFRFVGTTICYAYMQAVGVVNDHIVGCFRYREICDVIERMKRSDAQAARPSQSTESTNRR